MAVAEACPQPEPDPLDDPDVGALFDSVPVGDEDDEFDGIADITVGGERLDTPDADEGDEPLTDVFGDSPDGDWD